MKSYQIIKWNNGDEIKPFIRKYNLKGKNYPSRKDH